MTFNSAVVNRASQALRGYFLGGETKDRDEAHAALSDLILAARSSGDTAVEERLRQARELLSLGQAAANDADNLLYEIVHNR
ncbi:hypothetical protein NY551_18385 [Curtobacterium flaccumfaciens pv. oortii]|uniref:hypothetical protein n=1 Tax=Curtobacterium flaccumfaciens TaxID=2035 RepID=UPI00265A960F|nr:hypothetical protein [Curtobacterium flaccumfaciens]MCS5524706.1 hypothetical protein [Curtobacterium flaccumfaciens pv. oortii]